MDFDSSSNTSTTASAATVKTTTNSGSAQSSSKRRHHMVSPYYLYCLHFIEEGSKSGRLFRTLKQGFAAASIKWNKLSKDEQIRWRETCRIERMKCLEEGTVQKLKMRNGDKGDPNCDPTELGILKDMNLKKERDVNAITARLMWSYPESKDLLSQPFLLVSARPDPNNNGGFTSLAIVEFSLGNGITKQFHVNFSGQELTNVVDIKYNAIRRILDWPRNIERLGGVPVFFTPPGQMEAVFDALSFVDSSSPPSPSQLGDPKVQLDFTKDLAGVEDLQLALRDYFKKSKVVDEADTFEDEISECCLTTAHQCVGKLLSEFHYLDDE